MNREDKQLICNTLVPVLQQTRAYREVSALIYNCLPGGREYVDVYNFNSGKPQITVNVTMDSGAAMLDDILENLRRFYL